ncbi:olfactory receptor 52N4-like [Chanos chanos]|uniref:Olfactory receptor 52N4-like n=1 Tax=Chanos chanos TaxID=29144 RepID=A0A6J2WYK1_CHACN|nr:olfactory receptor 52N4-like [Chanos chanos]XP_030649395.1 olfactory receptor 52N4-like [Chanos chanos]
MENKTEIAMFHHNILFIEGLIVTEQTFYPAFILFLLAYVFIMVSNIGLLVLITMGKTLHEPMYILLCNLPVNDALGASVMIPRLLYDVVKPASERYITFSECVIQAYGTHVFGTTSHTVLMIMAYDRYVAICNPLRYPAIMTNKMVIKLTVFAWGVAFVLVGILLGLTVQLSHCRSAIENPSCDNPSLFKLSCEDLLINQIYGLAFTAVLWAFSVGSIALTYVRIAEVCLRSKNSALNSKAVTTCSTHLLVYIIVLTCACFAIVLHRFPDYTFYRKMATIMLHVIPTGLNPVIYGLQTKEIKHKILNIFSQNK